MEIEYKAVPLAGVVDRSIQDGPGVVEAIVSVTGLIDNVNDVIEPGAYATSLAEITPKGVWSHDWNQPTSRTLEAKELLPGDPALPRTLPNGQPWPAEAGALKIKMKFNLDTQRGREAHSDVLFFGDQQEWSIGYKVPDGGATYEKNAGGARRIHRLNCYEYSPVLFGAMPAARTASAAAGVKSAQMAFKAARLAGEIYTLDSRELVELKSLAFGKDMDLEEKRNWFRWGKGKRGGQFRNKPGDKPRIKDEGKFRIPLEYEDDDPTDKKGIDMGDGWAEEAKALGALSAADLRTAIKTLTTVLQVKEAAVADAPVEVEDGNDPAHFAFLETEALAHANTADAVAAIVGLAPEQRTRLDTLATTFDVAVASANEATIETAAQALLGEIGALLDDADTDDATYSQAQVAVRVAADQSELPISWVDGETYRMDMPPEQKSAQRVYGPEFKHLVDLDPATRRAFYFKALAEDDPGTLVELRDRFYGDPALFPEHAEITTVLESKGIRKSRDPDPGQRNVRDPSKHGGLPVGTPLGKGRGGGEYPYDADDAMDETHGGGPLSASERAEMAELARRADGDEGLNRQNYARLTEYERRSKHPHGDGEKLRKQAEAAYYKLEEAEKLVDYLDSIEHSTQEQRDKAAEAANKAKANYRQLSKEYAALKGQKDDQADLETKTASYGQEELLISTEELALLRALADGQ